MLHLFLILITPSIKKQTNFTYSFTFLSCIPTAGHVCLDEVFPREDNGKGYGKQVPS